MLGLILGGSLVMALAAASLRRTAKPRRPGQVSPAPGAAARIVRRGAIGACLRPKRLRAAHPRVGSATRERQNASGPVAPILRGGSTRYLFLHRSGRSLATGRGYSMSFCFLISDVVSAAIAPTSRGMLSGL